LSQFSELGLAAPIARAVEAKGYRTPTPIQLQAIPQVIAGGDVLGIAATGTGKTAAFALPILNRLHTGAKASPGTCRALILCPTRELANQIAESFRSYASGLSLTVEAVFGGVSYEGQNRRLRRGTDIVIATPGRLLDHLDRRTLKLDHVAVLVLDEADHMLDLGFIPAVRRIVKALPRERQTLMFSATMPGEIRSLASEMLRSPKTISVTPPGTPASGIDQSVVFVETAQKRRHLIGLLGAQAPKRALVFTRTKHGADRVVKDLIGSRIAAAAIHGNKSQNQRERALEAFRSGHTPVLVATDIAARGIDIDDINLVINFDLPHVAETYVHRIGRTARAGAAGAAISLCAPDERPLLKAIEKLVGRQIAVIGNVPVAELPAPPPQQRAPHENNRNHKQPNRHGPKHGHHRGKPRGDRSSPQMSDLNFMRERQPADATGGGRRRGR